MSQNTKRQNEISMEQQQLRSKYKCICASRAYCFSLHPNEWYTTSSSGKCQNEMQKLYRERAPSRSQDLMTNQIRKICQLLGNRYDYQLHLQFDDTDAVVFPCLVPGTLIGIAGKLNGKHKWIDPLVCFQVCSTPLPIFGSKNLKSTYKQQSLIEPRRAHRAAQKGAN
jgi:hypothetical protein